LTGSGTAAITRVIGLAEKPGQTGLLRRANLAS